MRRVLLLTTLVPALIIAAAAPGFAQPNRQGSASSAFQVRAGYFFPRGGGEVWDENQDVFTMEISDFNDFVWGLGFTTSLQNNIEVGFNADFYGATMGSGYRDYEGSDGFPILHDTRLRQLPLTVDLRFLPTGRYRSGSQSRSPLQPVFYLGAGVGLNLWGYEEVGEFIDFSSPGLEIIPARFTDSGVTWEAHALAGLELPLNPGFNLLFEGRYSWSRAELGNSLSGLGDLQLGGASVYVGGAFRF